MLPRFKEGDLVKVIGENGIHSRGGYTWTSLKNDGIGHIYEVSDVKTWLDTDICEEVPIYELRSFEGDEPPTNYPGRPYHWAEDWLEPAEIDHASAVDAVDFESIFN